MPEDFLKEDESIDELILGGMKIIQPRSGYRFSIDSILLAHFVEIEGAATIIDLGTGNGVIPILLSLFSENANIIGIELQEKMVDRAQRSLKINNIEARVKILQADIKDAEKILPLKNADIVVANPPFWKKGEGLVALNPEKAIARHELKIELKDIISAANRVLKPQGKLYLVQNADRMLETIELLQKSQFFIVRIRMVHPYHDKPAKQILMEARKNRGTKCTILSPLIIYTEKGEYSNEIKKMYR